MEETHSMNDWYVMGLALGVPPNVIERINQESLTVQNFQHKILYHWLETGCASWAKLVKALRSSSVCKEGLAREIARNHPCKCLKEYRVVDRSVISPVVCFPDFKMK